ILGMTLATQARATALLFPCVEEDTEPQLVPAPRALKEEDFFTSKTEDRYPGHFPPRARRGGPGH
ncbi:hypothetical protein ACWD48_36420, partial [Streptomyces sp. NPDC002519]